MNYILDYYSEIKSKKIITSKKISKTYKFVVEKIINNPDSDYYYNHERAMHIITFIEKFCKHSKGKLASKPFLLSLRQKAQLSIAFGILDKETDLRKYTKAIEFVARKNGKSTLASAVGLYLLVADDEGGSEVYAVATKRDQAKIIWNEAKRMVNKSPALKKRIKTLVGEIKADFNDSSFKPLGRDSETLDGLNVHGALFDEIHAWTDRNMMDVIIDGTASREQPLIWGTTTAGTVRMNVYDDVYTDAEATINAYATDEEYDEHSIYFVYELDDIKEWKNPKMWFKANPELGTAKNVDNLRVKVEMAIKDSKLVNNLLTKDFNIPRNSAQTWIALSDFRNTSKVNLEKLKPRYGIGGIDLSKTTDLTCATVLFKIPNDVNTYVKQMYWIPSEKMEEKIKMDNVPYDTWLQQGWLRVCEGGVINYHDVTEWFLEVQNEMDIYLFKIGYDSWSARYLVDELKGYFGENTLQQVIQGKKTLSSPMLQLEAELKAKRIVYDANPILEWCITNVAVDIDKNANIQPIKTENARKRIDGFASLLDAYVIYTEDYENYMGVI